MYNLHNKIKKKDRIQLSKEKYTTLHKGRRESNSVRDIKILVYQRLGHTVDNTKDRLHGLDMIKKLISRCCMFSHGI